METSKREVEHQYKHKQTQKVRQKNEQLLKQQKLKEQEERIRQQKLLQQQLQEQKEEELAAAEDTSTAEDDVTFFHDFVAGGIAGSASVVVGHPFDTLKVRMQASSGASQSLLSMATQFGGVSSLFRGLTAPLISASAINALIFASYGTSSRLFDQYLVAPNNDATTTSSTSSDDDEHDPWQKSFICGAFAGLVQCVVVCPMEHIKCRLQLQHGKGSADNLYKGPASAVRSITRDYGVSGLFRGWWATSYREVPAFAMYFSFYDFAKDRINCFFAEEIAGGENGSPEGITATLLPPHSHAWLASALAGGTTGALTWAAVYPIDVIKTRIQTVPIQTPVDERRILTVGREIVKTHGWRHLFRGLNVTLIRAFPVNGIIFPVYEFVLMQIAGFGY